MNILDKWFTWSKFESHFFLDGVFLVDRNLHAICMLNIIFVMAIKELRKIVLRQILNVSKVLFVDDNLKNRLIIFKFKITFYFI